MADGQDVSIDERWGTGSMGATKRWRLLEGWAGEHDQKKSWRFTVLDGNGLGFPFDIVYGGRA